MVITDKDINKMKAVFAAKEDLVKFATKEDLVKFATKEDLVKFATKEDLVRFATKEDLERFSTKEDLSKVTEKFVTKNEFGEFKSDMLDFKNDYLIFKDEMLGFRDGMEDYKKKSLNNMDFIFQKLVDINHELKAFTSLYRRHDLEMEKIDLRVRRLEATKA